jgi:DNA-binding protein H-NS
MPKKTLAQIEAQIQRLQAEAESIRKREVDGVIARMKEAIAHYQLTAEDLGLAGKQRALSTPAPVVRRQRSKKSPTKAANGVAKFSDGTNTWTGMGPKPKWFKAALAAGKTAEDLQVR